MKETHITKTCGAAFYHLHNIRRIRKHLSQDTAETLIHAFVTSIIYSFQRMNNLAANFLMKAFLLYKLYNYFPPSDIPSNNENNKFNYIATVWCPLVPGVVLQLKVSQSTGQDLVAFQVHPTDLPRTFQRSLKLDNYYQA